MTDILLVEDNEELAEILKDFLQKEGYQVHVTDHGTDALHFFEKYGARLVVLDIMLPGLDGFSVCRKIRRISNTPILIVSAKTEKADKLNGLRLGADDYIEKPYDIDIMLAKIEGIFKRRYGGAELSAGDLRLNVAERTVYQKGERLEITGKEFELLKLFLENRGRVLSREYIFGRIWGMDSFSELQTLTVHIQRLRQKIEENPKSPERLLTVWGVGYKFV